MTIEQRVAVLEEIFAKLQDYYMSGYSGEEIDALLASAGVPIGITKEYQSVAEMNQDFTGTDVQRGQFVLILTPDTSSEDYGKVYLKGSANWVYVFTLTSLTAIKGPQGPAGKMGAKGADGADGKNFMVLGYYETLSALNAAVPSPGAGDTYGVGTEPPYAFYMYDPTISNWRYVGNLQGPAGPTGGEDNFVRYDAAQTLTDEQKAQARTNIGADTVQGAVRYDAAQTLADAQKKQARANIAAAPDGFGLGANGYPNPYTVITGETIDTLNESGLFWYRDANAPIYPDGGHSGTVGNLLNIAGNRVNTLASRQIFYPYLPYGAVALDISCMRIQTSDGEWQPWEWVNPPMLLGEEYRTTERYLGKPVYVKAVNFGVLPNTSEKSVTWGTSATLAFEVTARALKDDSPSYTLPIPDQIFVWAGGAKAYIKTTTDYSAWTGIATIKYTKTTD